MSKSELSINYEIKKINKRIKELKSKKNYYSSIDNEIQILNDKKKQLRIKEIEQAEEDRQKNKKN